MNDTPARSSGPGPGSGRAFALVVASALAAVAFTEAATCAAGDAAPATLDRRALRLVFNEDFAAPPSFYDAARHAKGRWKTNYWFGVQDSRAEKGWEPRTLVPNGEMQYYGDPATGLSPFEWKDGVLTIAARPNPRRDRTTNGLPYLSGLITTEKSFAFTYGYVEARIAFPSQKGLWPAFWLLPLPKSRNGQLQPPGSHEIDIFESVGEPGKLYFTWFPNLPGNRKQGDGMPLQTGFDLSAFHTYGVMVSPQAITWYLDGRQVRRVANKDFHEPLYLLLNMAVGGKWPGAPTSATQWPARMRIDYVRAYRLAGR